MYLEVSILKSNLIKLIYAVKFRICFLFVRKEMEGIGKVYNQLSCSLNIVIERCDGIGTSRCRRANGHKLSYKLIECDTSRCIGTVGLAMASRQQWRTPICKN